jgi:hypothetical protein
MEDRTAQKFIHDLKQRLKRQFAPPCEANFHALGRQTVRSGEGGDELLDYQRYHWGSAPGPWY